MKPTDKNQLKKDFSAYLREIGYTNITIDEFEELLLVIGFVIQYFNKR